MSSICFLFLKSLFYVPDNSNSCLYAIILDNQDTFVDMAYLQRKYPHLDGRFIIQKLHDNIDRKTHRRFFAVSCAKYLSFKKEHKDGITTKAGFHGTVPYFDTMVIAYIFYL